MAMQSGFIKRIRDIMRMDAGINGDAQRIEQMVWMLFLKVYDAKEDDWELNEDDYESIIPEDLRWRNWAKADENVRRSPHRKGRYNRYGAPYPRDRDGT